MLIILGARRVADLAAFVSLFAERRRLLSEMDDRSAFHPLVDAPSELDAAIDEIVDAVRAQADEAALTGHATVAVALKVTRALEDLIAWSEERLRLALGMTFPGALPSDWEKALKLYAALLEEAHERIRSPDA